MGRRGWTLLTLGLAALAGLGAWALRGPEAPAAGGDFPIARPVPASSPPRSPSSPDPGPPAAEPVPRAPAVLIGQVWARTADGQRIPVADATLTAVYRRPRVRSVVLSEAVGPDGRFEVRVETGRLTLVAERPGGEAAAESPPLWVAPGDRRTDLELVFEAPDSADTSTGAVEASVSAAVVVGRGVDGAGRPVAGATVRAQAEGDGGPTGHDGVRTDSDGRGGFRLEIAEPAGPLIPVRALHPRFDPSPVTWVERGQPDPVVLELGTGGLIAGTVSGPPSLETARVTLEPGSERTGPPVPAQTVPLTDGEGFFELGPLAPGRYHLFAEGQGYGNARAPRIEVLSGVRTEGIVLRLEPGARLEGRVVDGETGLGVAGAAVVLGDAFRRYRGLPARMTRTDAEGRWALDGLEPIPRSLYVKKTGWVQRHLAGVDPTRRSWLEVELTRLPPEGPPEAEFFGVGAVIESEDGVVTIQRLMDGSAAAEAGAQVGDRIVAVDGVPASDLRMRELVDRLRGLPESTVQVQVAREGQPVPQTLDITRRRVRFRRDG